MKPYLLIVLHLAAASASAELQDVRALLKKNEPQRAAELLQARLNENPQDPWLLYNSGVAAYAAKDFVKSNEVWQQLATTELPEQLREQVWLQIGNAAYRLAEPIIEKEPDTAISGLEQSREAYRVAVAFNKTNKITAHNLKLVEKQLEKVYARLAQQLADEGKKEGSDERAIEKLQAALTYQAQAQALNPESKEHQQARKEIEQALAERFEKKAAAAEKRADQRKGDNEWERKEMQEQLQTAMADFQQAQIFAPDRESAREGEKRVEEKLANLFNKAARQQQKEGDQQAKNNPQQAAEKYEHALENFQEALAMKADHQDAQKGEKEVRESLEKLHLEQGDKLAAEGMKQAEPNPSQAAGKLLDALEHFEQAKAVAPENDAIQPRIDAVQAKLPELLVALGQKEQGEANQAEPQSIERAVAHLEKAAVSFEKAEQLAPENEPAKQGQKEVQEDLARLREQLAQNAEKQQPQKSNKPQESQESFESMLTKLKKEQEKKEVRAKPRAGQKYDPDRSSNLRNW
jgi:tetratricopeptide (TPR) repeat protein